ncbi:UDP-glucuronosyltransferase 1A1-like isoform 1-T1 [Clarias gariepinus]|uniref:UDP-glucuronosyltransferase 1A1-like n=1 Tax=Clarias gariepinus TaxID=13013 RepID=UPI00234C4CCC|nr:UDP-glucuronosyltransferase 1A1-like [Clarias gariepinus]
MGHWCAVCLFVVLLLCSAPAKADVTEGTFSGNSDNSEKISASDGTSSLGSFDGTAGPSKRNGTGRLLVVPMDGSHWTVMKVVAEELGRRGHAVMVLMPEVSMRLGSGKHYTSKRFPVPYTQELFNQLTQDSQQLIGSTAGLFERISGRLKHMREIMNLIISTSESLLLNHELVEFLRKQDFDAVLTDPVTPTGAILAFNLSLPAIYMLRGLPCGMDAIATGCPDPPSYIPRFFTKNTDRMCFTERVLNVVVYMLEPVMCKLVFWWFDDVASRFLQRSISMAEILNTAAVWLLRYDFTMEFPKPLAPNTVLIPGLNCAATGALDPVVLEFVEGSEHGVVVFTLGSLVPSLPKEKAAIFFQAFRRIPQRVIWRYTDEVSHEIPGNVKLMKWLPQNDLLGHPKTRAFITHGGSHGIYEGICHAVPMVMMPLFGDQGDNVQRMVSRGVGVALNFYDITTDVIVNALNAVINDSSYKERMMKLSALHNDQPVKPLDLAVYWTEYVMRHKGAEHLRLAALNLNWFQYHSLDVLGFLLVVIVIVVTVMIKWFMLCLRCCRKLQKRKVE